MARRPDTSSEENSSQVVDERPLKVKKERNRHARVEDAEEEEEVGMTLPVPGDDDEEEEENDIEPSQGPNEQSIEEEEEEEEEVNGSARGAKRQRTSAEGDYANGESRRSRLNVPLVRDKDGYVVGSVVRVKLHNFLTYDDVEFHPGPYLNMVLGPNGTGKSSIACALCLGLNYDAKILGRANKLAQFVKMNKDKGSIEIELKGPPGGRNLVIVRELTNTMTRQQSFHINGKKASGTEVSQQVREWGIQMDNLCSFLPQDKVPEFARMTPEELLRATEEAAGDKDLKKWHDKLITLGQEVTKMTQECKSEASDIQQLVTRNKNSENEVNAYRKRKSIEDEIRLLELLLPFKEYIDARNEYAALKERRERVHERCKQLEQRNRPALELKARMKAEYDTLGSEREGMRKRAKTKIESMKKIWTQAERVRQSCENVENELSSLKQEARNRKRRIEGLKNEIHKYEDFIANPPPVEDEKDIVGDEQRNNHRRMHEQRRKHDLEQTMVDANQHAMSARRDLEHAKAQLQRLDNEDAQKLDSLKARDADTATVVEWLRRNQNRFRKPVIEPAALSVSVKRREFVDAIEAGFNMAQLKTFVFQCEEDYKEFNRLICDTNEGMGRKFRVSTWFRPFNPNVIMPEPMTHDELKQLGFQGYAIDLINFPSGMEFYLRSEVKIHRLAIDIQRRVIMKDAMEMVTRPLPNGRPGTGNFIIGDVLSMVGRSAYGARRPFNNTRNINKARTFCNHSPDENQKKQLHQKVNEKTQLTAEVEEKIEGLRSQIQEIENLLTEIEDAGSQILQRRKDRNGVLQRIQTANFRLQEKTKRLEEEENAPSVEERKAELSRRAFDFAKQRFNHAKELQDTARAAMEETRRGTEACLKQLQVNANINALERMLETRDTKLREAMQEFNSIDTEFKEMKTSTKAKLQVSKQKLESADSETREKFEALEAGDELARISTDNVREELADKRAELSVSLDANSGVVDAYERREREIKAKTAALEEKEEKRKVKEERVRRLRAKWEPALQELVNNISERFSAAFDRVGCAGEVRLKDHPEDYALWKIEILVSFRDTEKMRELTATRQSGGERALSTIMYLMSLVEYARPPFSLVDEINQGMDQNYERAVHNSLVNVTCASSAASDEAVTSGQYFLITPKLLTDLRYHERMKVLCVWNGDWLPEPEQKIGGSLKKMVNHVVKTRALRAQMLAAAA